MKTGVVILNYNGWQDTLACAESVLASTVAPSWVVIVDNASTDDSVHGLRCWAAGHDDVALRTEGRPTSCSKPLKLVEIISGDTPEIQPGSIVLVHNSTNKGYAAGNNAGIRLLMQWGADAVWILNNDTVLDKAALGAMCQRLFAKQRPGLCGSLVRYMEHGDVVQCRGGGFTSKWTGLSVLDGHNEDIAAALSVPPDVVEQRINFIYGASIMASRAFIEQVGLLDERYFLYCEEQDWAYSSGGMFDFAYAPDAIVYHKEGGSTGFSRKTFNARVLWHLTRSRLLLTWKHTPTALPIVCASILYAAMRMAWRRVDSKK